jgi:large subunit ribosomal protein L25
MTITVPVSKRDGRQSAAATRAAGNIPGVVYGPKQQSIPVTLEARAFALVDAEAGEATIISLTGLHEPIEVLIKDVAFHPITHVVTHVDFYAIERGKPITVDVPIDFVGEAPVTKSGGVVTKVLHEVSVTCRPSALPSEITVDMSVLTDIDQRLTIADLKLPPGVTVDADPDEVVAIVSAVADEGAAVDDHAQSTAVVATIPAVTD